MTLSHQEKTKLYLVHAAEDNLQGYGTFKLIFSLPELKHKVPTERIKQTAICFKMKLSKIVDSPLI